MKVGQSILFALAVAASPWMAGCGQSKDQSHVIKIVSSLPHTSKSRKQTETVVDGIKMALEDANHKAGSFTIDYDGGDLDDATAAAQGWTAEKEADNANSAAADPDVMAYIGPFNSGAAKSSMPILNRAGLLMISPANTAVELTKPDPDAPDALAGFRPTGKINYFRVVPTDDLQGKLAADWAKELGVKRVFVLDDRQVYGQGIANVFEAECRKIGLTVLGRDGIDTHSPEFQALLNKIKEKNPDLIYFGGTTDSKGDQLAKDMVEKGLTAKLMVPDGCMEDEFISSAGAKNVNDRCYVTFGGLSAEAFDTDDQEFLAKHKSQKDFVDRYTKRFGHAPQPYAIYGYEAAKVALEAIRRADKKDRAAIVAACAQLKDFPGVLGTWSFDENGDTTLRQLSGYVVHDGHFKFVKLLGN